jgi:predicted RecB family nuclease
MFVRQLAITRHHGAGSGSVDGRIVQYIDNQWVFSASDLTLLLDCEHATDMNIAHRAGLLDVEPVPADGMVALAGKHGIRHEERVLQRLRQEYQVVEIESPNREDGIAGLVAAAEQTQQAMASGAEVIYQGCFFDGQFLGYSDFLMRTDDGYEVYDTKLAKSVKEAALVQLASYSDQVARLGFPMPTDMHVWLGTDEISSHAVADYLDQMRQLRADVEQRLMVPAAVPDKLWADKRSACGGCGWRETCAAGRDEARDLSLIHGIRGNQVAALRSEGIDSVEALVAADPSQRPAKLSAGVFDKLRSQARLQSVQDAGRSETDPVGPVSAEFYARGGVDNLPPRSEGDVWFDIEGDPFAPGENGLEYLFGYLTAASGHEEFTALWAHTPAEEKAMLADFVSLMQQRIDRWPDLHIYHYANYERTKLRKLAEEHQTCAAEIQQWFDEGRLVDLEKIFRGSFRVSQRSYSLKKLEPLYGLIRDEDVQTAGDSVVDYEEYLELLADAEQDPARAAKLRADAQAKLAGIRDYNEVDCRSTYLLDTWIREQASI